MMHRVLFVALAMLACCTFTTTAAAQNCPHTRARHIDESLRFWGKRDCGNLVLRIGGISVTDEQDQGCPLLANYVPAHDVEEPSPLQTRTQVVTTTPTLTFFFKCERIYLLIVPIGSDCRVDRTVNNGVVTVLSTMPCGESNG